MSLIIGIRCKNGCLVIADRRNHIKSNGVETHQDDFDKVVRQPLGRSCAWLALGHGLARLWGSLSNGPQL